MDAAIALFGLGQLAQKTAEQTFRTCLLVQRMPLIVVVSAWFVCGRKARAFFFPRGRWQSALELPCCACSRVREPWHVPTSAPCSSTRGGSLQLCAVRPDLCCGGAPSFCFCASKPCSLLELPAGLPRRCRRVAARCGVCAPCPGNRAWPSLESLWAAGTWGARSQHRGLKSTPVSGKKEPAESKPRPDATKAATWILSRQAGMRRARWWCPALTGGWDPTTS